MATIYGRRLSVGSGVSPNPPENWQQLIYIDESETWSAPKDGWYRFHVVGKCGSGANGDSRHTVNMQPVGTGYGGGGGGSGGWAIHVLKIKEGDTIEITINNSLTSLGEYCYATAGQNASGRTGGQGGEAEGGNIMNLIGGKGGDGGDEGKGIGSIPRNSPQDGGLNGAKAGANYGTGINYGGGGGGGGAGYNRNEKPNVAYIGDITQYAGGNGGYYDTSGARVTPTGGGIYPNPTPEDDPNILIALYGGGNGGGGFYNLNSATLPVGQGSAGSPGCIIIEVEAEK